MPPARRTHGFRESVIRGMTRLAREYGSLNLAQGFPNIPAPDHLKEAAATTTTMIRSSGLSSGGFANGP